jgi:glycosyltransferase involved in cell wall biosynthesis
MQQPLRRLAQTRDFDVAHFEQLYLVELLPEVGDLPAVLGEQNVEFQVAKNLQQVASNPVHRIRDGLSWKKMFAFETYWAKQFPVCVTVSEQDAALLRETSGHAEIQVVTNGVDCQSFAPVADGPKRQTDTVLFFGTLNYGPNRDGIVRFCRDTWPIVHAKRPEARLEIVGIDPPPDVQALGELPGVVFAGFVPDIRTKLWTATMSIAPLRWGGGTRLKIVESLAAECPVVSTTAGAEGLELEDGTGIRIADRPEEFARAMLDLMDHPDKRAALAREGRQAVVEKYDWKSSARQLELAYDRAIRLGRQIRPLHSSPASAVR